jgi:hypothetical protein
MTRLRWVDRLRIERAVWRLDWLAQDLPGRTRRSMRRDLRANLRAAAADVGAAQAIRNLGSLHQVAADYIAAEYGDRGPRPTTMRGIGWAFLTEAIILGIVTVAFIAFYQGVTAAAAQAGTYRFDTLTVLGFEVGVTTFEDDRLQLELAIYPWLLAYPLAALMLGGRWWRYVPAWWRSRGRPQAG